MKIVIVGPFGLRIKGTVARRALPLARALAARGHDVTLLIPPWDSPEDGGQEWTDGGAHVVHIAVPDLSPLARGKGEGETYFSVIAHLRLAIDLAAAAWVRRPAVVHLFKPKGHAGAAHLLLWFLRRCGIFRARLVVDSDDWEGPGGWNDVAGYSLAARWLFAWQERWGLRHADAVTAASRVLAHRARALRDGRGNVFYLPNGVPAGAQFIAPLPKQGVQPRQAGAWLNAPTTSIPSLPLEGGGPGRGVKVRNPDLLWFTRFSECSPARGLRLFRRVQEQVPQARLVVAGKGLHGEERELLSLAATQGLAGAVEYRGWVDAQDLPALFAMVTAAMFPIDDTTLQRARCPARLADLLAAGVPVVAERVGEAATYIKDGESGLLVRPDDEAAFVTSLVCLLTEEGLRQRLREGAILRMAQEFSWMTLAEQAETAYRTGG